MAKSGGELEKQKFQKLEHGGVFPRTRQDALGSNARREMFSSSILALYFLTHLQWFNTVVVRLDELL